MQQLIGDTLDHCFGWGQMYSVCLSNNQNDVPYNRLIETPVDCTLMTLMHPMFFVLNNAIPGLINKHILNTTPVNHA